eukprot:g5276.t1
MDLQRPTLLGTLAIVLSFSHVCPLSTTSPATLTFRGSGRTTATSQTSSPFHSTAVRCRRRPHQHLVAAAAATALAVAAASPPPLTGERAPAFGHGRRRRNRRQLRKHGPQNARRQAALLFCAADGRGDGAAAAAAAAPVATGEADATATKAPQDPLPAVPARRGTSLPTESTGSSVGYGGNRGSGTTFREAFNGRLPDWLLTRLEELRFATPTLVQRQALEVILGGGGEGEEKSDAVLHAQTGSGKTLAFLLPLFALIEPSRSAVQGLVVVPTRELGLQVAGVAKRLAAGSGSGREKKIQVMSVLEGSSNKRQRAWAWADPPHIVVGNPENLSRLVTTGAVRVNAVSYVVVDEVDACLLSEGTRSWLHELLARSLSPTHAEEDDQEDDEEAARLVVVGAGRVTGAAVPANKRVKDRQTVFASATVPQHNHFIRQCVQQWKRSGGGGAAAQAPPRPPLAEFLREELGLNARADAMSLFREGHTRLLVSTDMAARGLDVPEITHVFNLDLPLDGEGYVHRGGRAGRLGRPGKVISLVTPKQEFVIRRLGNGIGVDIKKISLGSSNRKRGPKPPSGEE